ncbi:hypothetical protein GTR02_20220, partial [Kineococcus sp. R8]|uniref:glycosyltransferase family 39 protein n=1 Tax=Kineococcus siccus TaxID=2696567 RepID=UPI001411C67E
PVPRPAQAPAAPARDAATPAPGRRWPVALDVAVGAGAAAVSFAGSWVPSLWTDEAATIGAARRSVADLGRLLLEIDAVHGLYYALMHLWIGAFGSSAVSVRLPSALAVGVAAVGVLHLARRLTSDPGTAVLAAAVFALLPRVTWTGVEARPSAAATAVAVWCTVLLLAALRGRRPLLWFAYGACGAVGVAVNIYLALLLAGHGVSLLLRRTTSWRDRGAWACAAAGALLVSAPVVVLAQRQSGQLGERAFGWLDLLTGAVVSQWFLGETPTATSGAALDTGSVVGTWWRPAAVALAALCWLLVLRGLVPGREDRAVSTERAVWLLPWIVLPTALVGVYALLVGPLYNPRYFAFAAPAVAIAVAAGLARLRGRVRWAAAVAALVLVVPVYVSQREAHAKSGADWAQAAAHLCARATAGDAVYFGPRRPPTDGVATLTTRGVAVAYPACFRDLVDLTLVRSPVQAADLTGTSRSLADALEEGGRPSTIWVLRRPGDVVAPGDDALLASAGYERRSTWRGPLDEVVEFSRR